MSTEELQTKYDKLFDKVRQMRGYQKEYFKYRASSDLEKSKRFEREVDQIIKDEVQKKESKQIDIL
jgi:hypothetical protein